MSKHQPELSKCHNAPVTIGGTGDFDDKDAVVTQYYVCPECGQPCDLQHQPDSLDDILKDFGLEVSGGDFTKEHFLKAKALITAKLQEVDRAARTSELHRFYEFDPYLKEHAIGIHEFIQDRIASLKGGDV